MNSVKLKDTKSTQIIQQCLNMQMSNPKEKSRRKFHLQQPTKNKLLKNKSNQGGKGHILGKI